MDLVERGQQQIANVVLNRYLTATKREFFELLARRVGPESF